MQVALVSKVEEEHRRFTVAKGKEFPPLVVCVFSAGSCGCTGKSNERELIQTYTESESASLFLWSVLSHSLTCTLTSPSLPSSLPPSLPPSLLPALSLPCSVLWRQLLETGAVSMTCIKIVQRSQAKKLAAYARKMVDYVVFTCPPPSNSAQFNQVHLYILWLFARRLHSQ